MGKKSFMPQGRAARRAKLTNYAAKMTPASPYATKYNKSATELASIQADKNALGYWIDLAEMSNTKNREITHYLRQLENGVAEGEAPAAVPTALVFPTPIPAAVPPGIIARFSASALTVKAMDNYSSADGMDLGIEGDEIAGRNSDEMKPVIAASLTGGGAHVMLEWTKKGMDAIDFYGENPDASWTFLGTDVTPNWIDTRPMPAPGTSAIRRYKAIYREDDAQVGQWSDIVSITVAGTV